MGKPFKNEATILITGGAGFIGSHFAELIFDTRPDWTILVLDNLTYAGSMNHFPERLKKSERFEFWYGNVTNSDLVSTLVSRSDYVVHFAAETHVARSIFDNRIFYETDVIGTQCISNAVKKYMDKVKRFIFISTSEVYGTAVGGKPMSEDHPLNPMSPYASAKAGADRLVYSYVQTYRIPAIIVRPFNQFGPRQHLEKLVPRVITSVLRGEEVLVHGDGDQMRDWSYVGDTCKNILTILEHPGFDQLMGEAVNLGVGETQSILEICKLIFELSGGKASDIRHVGDRPGNVRKHLADIERYKSVFGKPARSDMRDAIRATIEWYRNNPNLWADQVFLKEIPVRLLTGEVEYH